MALEPLTRVVIVGGGTAGWMTAALISRLLPQTGAYPLDITLVESDDIGTIGVGEATIPAIKRFNELLEIDEVEFMKFTRATFKLGIQFEGWGWADNSYVHGFGKIGHDLGWLRMHQYWLKMRGTGRVSDDFGHYSINTAAAVENRFLRARQDMQNSPFKDVGYAYHFDAGLFARYLRTYGESRGVTRVEGKIHNVELNAETGFVEAVHLENGTSVGGELFIDCSGLRALLIDGAMKSSFEHWDDWLPCDRAVAMPCAHGAPLRPYTRSIVTGAGWQWRIPLQHRMGNGHVYSRRFMSDDEAIAILKGSLDGAPLGDPRLIRFHTGMRRLQWKRNVVAIGLSGGFLEPLESTSIHLIQSAALRLINMWPDKRFARATSDEYNAQAQFDYERIRDFIIAHYKVSGRDDTPMWRYCRDMDIPETLRRKLDVFAEMGRVFKERDELFAEESWIQVLIGQGLMPRTYDPCVDVQSEDRIVAYLNDITDVVRKCVDHMPSHEEFIAAFCPSDTGAAARETLRG